MAPWGGREKVLGTNPWSIAAPGADGRVVAVDIANTAVARGKIYLAKNRGEPIPDTWALSPDGAPTTDAAEGVLGVILPMAGHKGYAITFLMDVLSGALTGSGVGTDVRGPYEPDGSSRCGHLFLALDPAAFGDPPSTEGGWSGSSSRSRACRSRRGSTRSSIPGEVEDRAEAATLAAGGIVLAEQSLADLHALATSSGVAFPTAAAG